MFTGRLHTYISIGFIVLLFLFASLSFSIVTAVNSTAGIEPSYLDQPNSNPRQNDDDLRPEQDVERLWVQEQSEQIDVTIVPSDSFNGNDSSASSTKVEASSTPVCPQQVDDEELKLNMYCAFVPERPVGYIELNK